ncbi:hypothetical protein HK102_007860 [Quaeritorhiza haematococci]|nr:hypothetical protein HK102_007860 [Quaeritorhiza haematococci]
MTNVVYHVRYSVAEEKSDVNNKSDHHPQVLLRIYGHGAEQFIERESELLWMCHLSSTGVGPKLLGCFANGRFEEFVDSITLNKHDLRDPATSREIARELFRLHYSGTQSHHLEVERGPEIWQKLKVWHGMAVHALEVLKQKKPKILRKLDGFDLEGMDSEIERLRMSLADIPSPLVFCHNDSQYGNILRLKNRNGIMIVDYEYAGVNPRGYDIGNHFCEWAADYHSSEPHRMHFNLYPSREEQLNFLEAYVDAEIAQLESSDLPHERAKALHMRENREEVLEHLLKESNKYALCSHLLWGLWGVMQAPMSEISFNYVGYAAERFGEYFQRRDEFLAM